MLLEGVLVAAAVVLVTGAAVMSLAAYARHRWPRVLICPADGRRAAVTVDARQAALTVLDDPTLRVESCSSWSSRPLCDQPCLAQLGSPDAWSVRGLMRWLGSRKCARCGGRLGRGSWSACPPALEDLGGRQWSWFELQPERVVAGIMAGVYRPVCWRCSVRSARRAGARSD
jgi:hypothetical protein